MELIYEIVGKLRNQELRQVREWLQAATFAHEKVGKLFQLVTRFPLQAESFYSQKLYGKEPDNTFRVAKSRLKRLLEQVLLQDKSLTGYGSEAIHNRLMSRRRLLQGEVLLGRGAYAAAWQLLAQVEVSAAKYELPEEQFQAGLLLYRSRGARSNTRHYERETQRLLELNRHRADLAEAQILHYAISNRLFQQTLKSDTLAALRAQVARIGEIATKGGRPQTLSLYYLSETQFHQAAGDLEKALIFSEKYLELLLREASLQLPVRIGGAYLQLAQICLQLNRLDAARGHAKQALDILEQKDLNYLVALEVVFRVHFSADELNEAGKALEKALAHPHFESSKILAARWHYFQACLCFRQGQFKAAWLALNDTAALLADKYGTNLYIRLLEIMVLFELKHLDLMDSKIQNMRQFIRRTQKDQSMRRPMALLRLLMAWSRLYFDFKAVQKAAADEFLLLAQLRQEGAGAVSDFELIRLEEWMRQK